MAKFWISFMVEGTMIANDVQLDRITVEETIEVGFRPRDTHGAVEGDCKISNLKILTVVKKNETSKPV